MHGVRRLLGGVVNSSPPSNPDSPLSAQTVPLSKAGPTWPPSSPSAPQHSYGTPSASPNTTSALFLKKDRPKPPPAVDDDASRTYPAGRQSLGTTSNSQSNPIPSPTRSQTMPTSSPAGPSSVSGRGTPPSSYSVRDSTRKSGITDPDWKRISGNLNTRDELLISLMASEAVIDSRDFEIITAEEVDDLKKVFLILIYYQLANDHHRKNKSSTLGSRR